MKKITLMAIVTLIFFANLLSTFNAQNSIDGSGDSADNDFETWKAPAEIRRNYPYYHAGYDDEGRPIWVTEFGKWNLRKLVEEGQTSLKIFDKYCDQWAYRVQKSLKDKSTPESPVTGWVFIFDMEGYSLSQLSHVPTVAYSLKQVAVIEKTCRNMDYGFLINLNYVAETILNAARPLLGSTLERAHVSGTNKAKWLPNILSKIPKNQLPEHYGGYSNYTPIAVFG